MIYTGEDKRKVYLKCEKCNHITNVPKAFIKENNNEYIKISIALSCDCKTGNETDIFYKTGETIIPKPMSCPRCQSKNITIQKRGFTWTTAFVGMNKNERVCMNCLHKW